MKFISIATGKKSHYLLDLWRICSVNSSTIFLLCGGCLESQEGCHQSIILVKHIQHSAFRFLQFGHCFLISFALNYRKTPCHRDTGPAPPVKVYVCVRDLYLSLPFTAPCKVEPNRVLKAVGSSSFQNLDPIAVIRAAWSNPIKTSTLPPQLRRGGRSTRWLQWPRSFSHSITAAVKFDDRFGDRGYSGSTLSVQMKSSVVVRDKWVNASSPTPLTTKVCRSQASRSRHLEPSRMSVESLPLSISTLTATASPLASSASTPITLNAIYRRSALSVVHLAVFSAGVLSLGRTR